MKEQIITKWNQFKLAVQNPPPDRLAAIEYRSHFLQIMGVLLVCIILIVKGFWYVIFAFIFSMGISYSQGMSAYQKYKTIKSFMIPENPEDFEKDLSLTRKRSKIVKYIFGDKVGWFISIIAVVGAAFIINPSLSRWYLNIAYVLAIMFIYVLLYFFIAYWVAYPIYKRRVAND